MRQTFLFFAAFCAWVWLPSCNTNPCRGINCGPQGSCTDGLCICNDGYEKDLDGTGACQTKWSAKFVGDYSAEDTCRGASGNATYAYPVRISETSEKRLTISDFNRFFVLIQAEIRAGNVYELHLIDSIANPAGIRFQGKGTLSASKTELHLNYIAIYPDQTRDTCASHWIKQ